MWKFDSVVEILEEEKKLLQEALPLNYAKGLSKKWKENNFKPKESIFKGRDRITLPDEIKPTTEELIELDGYEPYKKVKNFLTKLNYRLYSVEQYIEGICLGIKTDKDGFSSIDSKNPIKIGRVLEKADDEIIEKKKKNRETGGYTIYQIKKHLDIFKNDPIRQGKNKTLRIVISRHPYDVAGMSTDRNWTSCMNLGLKGINYHMRDEGMYAHKVSYDIKYGTIVAYLVDENDKTPTGKWALKRPLARISLKPWKDIDDGEDAYDIGKNYGANIGKWREAVNEWRKEVLNKNVNRDSSFYFPKQLYNDASYFELHTTEEPKQEIDENTFERMVMDKFNEISASKPKYPKIEIKDIRHISANLPLENCRFLADYSFSVNLENVFLASNVRISDILESLSKDEYQSCLEYLRFAAKEILPAIHDVDSLFGSNNIKFNNFGIDSNNIFIVLLEFTEYKSFNNLETEEIFQWIEDSSIAYIRILFTLLSVKLNLKEDLFKSNSAKILTTIITDEGNSKYIGIESSLNHDLNNKRIKIDFRVNKIEEYGTFTKQEMASFEYIAFEIRQNDIQKIETISAESLGLQPNFPIRQNIVDSGDEFILLLNNNLKNTFPKLVDKFYCYDSSQYGTYSIALLEMDDLAEISLELSQFTNRTGFARVYIDTLFQHFVNEAKKFVMGSHNVIDKVSNKVIFDINHNEYDESNYKDINMANRIYVALAKINITATIKDYNKTFVVKNVLNIYNMLAERSIIPLEDKFFTEIQQKVYKIGSHQRAAMMGDVSVENHIHPLYEIIGDFINFYNNPDVKEQYAQVITFLIKNNMYRVNPNTKYLEAYTDMRQIKYNIFPDSVVHDDDRI